MAADAELCTLLVKLQGHVAPKYLLGAPGDKIAVMGAVEKAVRRALVEEEQQLPSWQRMRQENFVAEVERRLSLITKKVSTNKAETEQAQKEKLIRLDFSRSIKAEGVRLRDLQQRMKNEIEKQNNPMARGKMSQREFDALETDIKDSSAMITKKMKIYNDKYHTTAEKVVRRQAAQAVREEAAYKAEQARIRAEYEKQTQERLMRSRANGHSNWNDDADDQETWLKDNPAGNARTAEQQIQKEARHRRIKADIEQERMRNELEQLLEAEKARLHAIQVEIDRKEHAAARKRAKKDRQAASGYKEEYSQRKIGQTRAARLLEFENAMSEIDKACTAELRAIGKNIFHADKQRDMYKEKYWATQNPDDKRLWDEWKDAAKRLVVIGRDIHTKFNLEKVTLEVAEEEAKQAEIVAALEVAEEAAKKQAEIVADFKVAEEAAKQADPERYERFRRPPYVPVKRPVRPRNDLWSYSEEREQLIKPIHEWHHGREWIEPIYSYVYNRPGRNDLWSYSEEREQLIEPIHEWNL
jgi:hypothetical protein